MGRFRVVLAKGPQEFAPGGVLEGEVCYATDKIVEAKYDFVLYQFAMRVSHQDAGLSLASSSYVSSSSSASSFVHANLYSYSYSLFLSLLCFVLLSFSGVYITFRGAERVKVPCMPRHKTPSPFRNTPIVEPAALPSSASSSVPSTAPSTRTPSLSYLPATPHTPTTPSTNPFESPSQVRTGVTDRRDSCTVHNHNHGNSPFVVYTLTEETLCYKREKVAGTAPGVYEPMTLKPGNYNWCVRRRAHTFVSFLLVATECALRVVCAWALLPTEPFIAQAICYHHPKPSSFHIPRTPNRQGKHQLLPDSRDGYGSRALTLTRVDTLRNYAHTH